MKAQQNIRKIAKSLVLAMLPIIGYAQNTVPELDSYGPVSPNAASLGQYGLFPVNYNLGTVNTGVPLYTINTGKQELPISLTYNTGGIRVNELASWVGLGWTLNSGGAIIRNVKGRPGPYVPYITQPPSPEVLDMENAAFNETNYDYLYRIWTGEWDSQPDEFVINAPGISGSFYFDEANNGKAVFNDHTPAKVTVVNNSKIEVIRADGTLLIFGTGAGNHDATEISQQPATNHENLYNYVSAWYLTEMISPSRKDTISFIYKNKTSMDYPVATGESVTINDGPIKGSYPNQRSSDKKYLSRIEFSNGYVVFNSVLDRQDLADEYRLSTIKVYAGVYGSTNTSPVLEEEFTFDHGYFQRSGGTYPDGYLTMQGESFNTTRLKNSREKSLKLNKVTIGLNGVGPDYSFEYNSTSLPVRGSTSQDFWGYANNNTGSLMIQTQGSFSRFAGPVINYDVGTGNREANETKMKAAILEKITYPTGGYTEFEYEANQYKGLLTQTQTLPGSENVTAFGPPSGQNSSCGASFQEKTFTVPFQNYVQGSGRLIISFSQAQGIQPTRVLFDTTQYNPPTPDLNEHYAAQTLVIDNVNMSGTHTIKAYEYRDELGSNGVYDCAITSISAHWQEVGQTTTTEVDFLLGGLRIKAIKSFDGVSSTAVMEKQFEYDNKNVLQPKESKSYKRAFLDSGSDLGLTISTNLYYDNNIGGRPVIEYGKVIEYDVDPTNGEKKGKTEYTYETIASQRVLSLGGPTFFQHSGAVLQGNFAHLYSEAQNLDEFSYFRTDNWRYGSLLKKEVFKGSGTTQSPFVTVSKEENDYYDNLSTSTIKQNYVFKNENHPLVDYEDWSYSPLNPSNGEYGMSFRFSYFVGEIDLGRKALKQTITSTYDDNGQNPVVTTTDYFYDNLVHLQPTRVENTNSLGQTQEVVTKYPDDVPFTSSLGSPNLLILEKQGIDKLKSTGSLHRVVEPVQVETLIKDANSNILSRNTQRTNYKDWATDLVLPTSVNTLKGTYNASTNPMEARITYHDYDDDGNPEEISKEDAPHVYYVWGYNGQYPIAKLENLSDSQVTTQVQNLFDAAVNASNVDDSTADENTLRSALNNIRNDSALSGALVTTYTYDPLVGVTSITDPGGRTQYYVYDSFNRLKEIRDQNNELVTEHKYHFKNQ